MSQKRSEGEFVDYAEKLDLVGIVTLYFNYTKVLMGLKNYYLLLL